MLTKHTSEKLRKEARFLISQVSVTFLPSSLSAGIPHVILTSKQGILGRESNGAPPNVTLLYKRSRDDAMSPFKIGMNMDANVPTRRRSPVRLSPTQPIADRISRALCHRLRLLHRSHANFYVLGATGNVYSVNLSVIPTCTCPDRTIPCKHILFVFLRVLGVSVDDACLRRKTLRPSQLTLLLGTPTFPGSLAGQRVRERFHQLFSESGRVRPVVDTRLEEGSTCAICLAEMKKEENVVCCSVCRNALHEECFKKWKSSSGRKVASCVMCRSRWREKREHEKYVNLAAYGSDEDGEKGGGGGGPCVD